MDGATPWLICTGAFMVPIVTFALGLYIGRNGLPYTVEIKKRDHEPDVGLG